MPLKLFVELLKGDFFHFYDTPNRRLIKLDKEHCMTPTGVRSISPTVAVIQDLRSVPRKKSIFDKTKGETDEPG